MILEQILTKMLRATIGTDFTIAKEAKDTRQASIVRFTRDNILTTEVDSVKKIRDGTELGKNILKNKTLGSNTEQICLMYHNK